MKYIYEYKNYSKNAIFQMQRRLKIGEDGKLYLKRPNEVVSDENLLDITNIQEYNFEKCLMYRYCSTNDAIIEYNKSQYSLGPYIEKNNIHPQCFNETESWSSVKVNKGKWLLQALEKNIDPEWIPLFYNESSQLVDKFNINLTWGPLIQSYINHYKSCLNEEWTISKVRNMIEDLKYISIQYARNMITSEIIPVGFFGTSIRKGAGGICFTNAELYVMPEFRRLGIAKELVRITFEKGLRDNITSFDSVTYRIPGMDALSFWENVGANISGLVHIEGDIKEMLNAINPNQLKIKNKNIN